MVLQIVTAGVIGAIIGGSAMTALQKSMAKIYARAIHRGSRTLDDVRPQTEEYRAYVIAVYKQLYPNEEI